LISAGKAEINKIAGVDQGVWKQKEKKNRLKSEDYSIECSEKYLKMK